MRCTDACFLVSLKCQDWRRFYTSHKYRLKTSPPDKCTLLLYADQRFKINLNQKALWDQAVNLLGRVINGPIDKAFSEVRPWLFVYDGISPLVWPLASKSCSVMIMNEIGVISLQRQPDFLMAVWCCLGSLNYLLNLH